MAVGFVVRSVGSLNAAPNSENFMPEGSNIGKYTFEYFPETADTYAFVIVWDTETGKSVKSAYKDGAWVKSSMQLPQGGLGN